jgi:hypothetical protein|tara:strand:- start:237 stop:434 length:198 start_codon:yes stop_codon:yes gene_type:complete
MDIKNLIFGLISLLVSIIIFIYELNEDTGIKQDDDSSFKYYSIKSAIIFLLLAIYLLWDEIIKII